MSPSADIFDDIPDTSAIAPGIERGEAIARIAWSIITEPGDSDAHAVIEKHGAEEALRRLIDGSLDVDTSTTDRWKPRASAEPVLRAIDVAQKFSIRIIVPSASSWPSKLNDLGSRAPIVLWVRGDLDALAAANHHSVAAAGARAMTGYGEHVVIDIISGLDADTAVVSGSAYGVEATALRAALAGDRPTVAVLSAGIDRFYPSGNEALLGRLAEVGAVISEVAPGSAPTKWRMTQAHRLIAALADATVVFEAGWRSTSLNIAGHAQAIGRAVGAVPGPVTSPSSAGCHRLIRDHDAALVTMSNEVDELIGAAPSV